MSAAADFWGLGDYSAVAPRLQPVADELVEVAAVAAGARVLDVAAGNGNVAVAGAARGAHVVACDLSPRMVAAGRERTASLDVEWCEADAHALPFASASMDVALSALGVMFAADPARAAAELFRVVRPGGTVAIASWTPTGFTGASADLLSEFLPTQSGPHPLAWGDRGVARARFAPHAAELELLEREVEWRFGDLDEAVAWFEHGAAYAAVRQSAESARYADLLARLRETIERFACDGVVLRPRYLIARATRRNNPDA